MSRQIIAIDFGTTFSSVAFLPIGSPHQPGLLQFGGARHHVPTMLRLDQNDHSVLSWGWAAQRDLRNGDMGDRSAVARDFKRGLGEREESKELTRQYLSMLAAEIKDREGRLTELTKENFITSIGVPANWTEEQSNLLKSLAEEVGFPEVRVLQEPVAAMHNLRCQAVRNFKFGDRPETFMVVDFGGGTLDICVVKTQELGREPHVIAVDGDAKLGGIDFDDLLEKWFVRQVGINWDGLTTYERAALREQVQDAKENMSEVFRKTDDTGVFQCTFHMESGAHTFAATKQAFHNRVREAGFLEKLAGAVSRAMTSCGLQSKEVKRVILTGGSSKWFFVRQIVAKEMGLGDPNELLETDSPYTDVASGLAICWGRTDEPPDKPGVWLDYKLGSGAEKKRALLLAPGRVQFVDKDRYYLGEIAGSRIFKPYKLELEWRTGATERESATVGRSCVTVYLRTNHPRVETFRNILDAARRRETKRRADHYKAYIVTRETELGGQEYWIEVQNNQGDVQSLRVNPNERAGFSWFGLGRLNRQDLSADTEKTAAASSGKSKKK